MTMLCSDTVKCAVCGTESEYTGIVSTNASGSSDLDMRPPEMHRSTMLFWVQRCPRCGYCASDLSEDVPIAHEIIESLAYKDRANDPASPPLARCFACQALINENAGNYSAAAWALIHAAWACDDTGQEESAKRFRLSAADMINVAQSKEQLLTGDLTEDVALTIDLMRRAGEQATARHLIGMIRVMDMKDAIKKVLAFQEALMDVGDTACHKCSEVFPDSRHHSLSS